MSRFLTAAALAVSATLCAAPAVATPYWIDSGVTLNARSGPGTNYHVIGTFQPCTRVHVQAYTHGWAKVSYNQRYYWVSAKYLQDHACGQGYKPKPKHGHSHGNSY
ncbi:SH3 domain-containing protein [Primorskyibacter sp. 2E107]|uniref:SH3 domain-containing protein n=1 Tax=Primorskyibacter sp. 2E107 TaxID=3403458 RepID=UPI003AF45BDB